MHDLADPLQAPETAAAAAEPAAAAPRGLPARKARAHRRPWPGRTFRFRPASFRFGASLSLRRFSITEAALLLTTAYLASKGLGVVRQSLFSALFGTGPAATAYFAAFRLPDTLFNLIAGGALSMAFIPVFVGYENQRGQAEAWRLASLVFNLLLVSLTALVLLAELLAPQFVTRLLVPGLPPTTQALTTTLTRILLLHPLILGLGTVATAVLHSKRQFLLPALSIAIYDVGLIAGLLVSLAVPRVGIYGPTFGVLVSGVCQVGVLLPALLKQGARYAFVWNVKHPGLRQVMGLLIPNLLAVGVASTASILDVTFASYLRDRASIAALANASLLYGLPAVLLAQAVGQALLPQLTLQAARGRYLRLRQMLLQVGGAAVLLSLPATLALYVFGKPAIHLFFQHGAFGAHSSALTSLALLGSAVGLPGLTASGLLVMCFYAMKDARTPLFTNMGALALHVGLLALLVKVITGRSAILAIPLATAITATAEAALLGLLLFTRLRKKVRSDKGLQRLRKRRLPGG